MHKVFIVSLYEGYEGKMQKFHFIGFYRGKKIKTILIKGGEFISGEAYLLAVQNIKVKGMTMYGDLIKAKILLS